MAYSIGCQQPARQITRVTPFGRAYRRAPRLRGVSERSIMAQTGHKSVMVARRYIRDGPLHRRTGWIVSSRTGRILGNK